MKKRKIVFALITLFSSAYLIVSLYALAEENKSLRSLGKCAVTGYYIAKMPVVDENKFVDRSGIIVYQRF